MLVLPLCFRQSRHFGFRRTVFSIRVGHSVSNYAVSFEYAPTRFVHPHMHLCFPNSHGEDDEEDGEEDSAHVEEEDTEQEAEERRCPEIFGSLAMSNNRKISIVEPITTDIVVRHCNTLARAGRSSSPFSSSPSFSFSSSYSLSSSSSSSSSTP